MRKSFGELAELRSQFERQLAEEREARRRRPVKLQPRPAELAALQRQRQAAPRLKAATSSSGYLTRMLAP